MKKFVFMLLKKNFKKPIFEKVSIKNPEFDGTEFWKYKILFIAQYRKKMYIGILHICIKLVETWKV